VFDGEIEISKPPVQDEVSVSGPSMLICLCLGVGRSGKVSSLEPDKSAHTLTAKDSSQYNTANGIPAEKVRVCSRATR
jgi:hypothetical protein